MPGKSVILYRFTPKLAVVFYVVKPLKQGDDSHPNASRAVCLSVFLWCVMSDIMQPLTTEMSRVSCFHSG